MADHVVGALHALHYLTPVIIWLSFTSCKTVATCLLHKPSRRANTKARRFSAIALLFLINITLVGQAISFFAESLVRPGVWASQDNVVYILASVLAYGSLTLGLLENSTPLWYPYLSSWLVATCFDVPVIVLTSLTLPYRDGFTLTRLAFQASRGLLLVGICVSGGWFALKNRLRNVQKSDETEPLLVNGANGSLTQPTGYGAVAEDEEDLYDDGSSGDIDSDQDEPDQLKEIKEQQKKRLAESGNWISYLKEYKIFAHLLWPSKDRRVQACVAVIVVVIIIERFLNVLVPRQLGIITNELASGDGNGVFPWKAIGIWAILSYLNSRAGIHVIQSIAEMPVNQFAYKSIGASSFAHIMGLSMDFHNEKNSGELIRAIDQGQNLQGLMDFAFFQLAPILVDLVVAFVYVSILFDIYMSFILVCVGIGYIYVGAKTTAWSIKRRRRFNTAWRNESKVQNEAIVNWQTVSHFNRGKFECGRYNETIDQFNQAEMSYYIAYYVGSGAQTLIMVLGRLAATFLAVYRVSQGTVPVGSFITLTAYWRSIEMPLAQMSWSIRRVTSMLTDAERLLQLFKTKPTVTDAPNAVDISIKEGVVEFEHVEFAYDPRRPTLKDVSFTAKPGQTIALVGETGGGKSTILKLLYRYYDVGTGVIRIDGQDIRGVTLDSLRDSFGMVPQDPSLFNATIMENVRYADLEATDEQVKEACRAAAIHDKIESFPDGYGATVGERGVKLSGGELQRVSIARAILRQPRIVLLDEATSMIDAETEALIQKAFKALTHSRTTFMIAHRLSTIQHADQILVINDGQIVEKGTHEELFALGGKYTALWSRQLNRENTDNDKPSLIDLDEPKEVSNTGQDLSSSEDN